METSQRTFDAKKVVEHSQAALENCQIDWTARESESTIHYADSVTVSLKGTGSSYRAIKVRLLTIICEEDDTLTIVPLPGCSQSYIDKVRTILLDV